MNIAFTSSPLSTVVVVVLAVLGVLVFVVWPIGRYIGRRRRPTRAGGALCRRLRQLGHDIDPPADERTQRAIAEARAALIAKLTGGGVR